MKKDKPEVNMYFWLGSEGEAIEVTEEEFDHLQRIWDGERPTDYPV